MKKREGFKGQKSIVLPKSIVGELRENPLSNLLYVTDIGYYPNAQFHHRERAEGSEEQLLIFCSEGMGWLEVDGRSFKISRNMYFIIPKGMPHRYGADEKNPWSIYWIHFAGQKAELFIGNSIQPGEIDQISSYRNIDRIQLFNEIYENLARGYTADNLEYANICLWHLLGSFRYLLQFQTVKGIQYHDLVEGSIAFMHNRLGDVLSLKDLADQAVLSPSHYSLLFKRKTGATPLLFFTQLKIQHGCRLLEFTDSSIKEIASELGFDDPYYFSRVFKKQMGVAPLRYRKNRYLVSPGSMKNN